MRILVLGGAGMLGSALHDRFISEGHDVAIVDNFSGSMKLRVPKGVKVFAVDATDLSSLSHAFRSFNPEALYVCINFFFEHQDRIYNQCEETKLILNVANNLCNLITDKITEVHYCSSSEVYGAPNPKKPVKESRKIIKSSSLRGTAFKAAEDMLSYKCSSLGLRFVSYRIFDMYGPRVRFTPITGRVSFIIGALLSYEQIGLSGANLKRDFVHVDDVVEVISSASKGDFSGILNVGTGTSYSLIDLCKALNKKMKIVYPPYLVPAEGFFSCVADTSLCKQVTGIVPKIKVSSCLESLIKFREEEKQYYSPANAANRIANQRKA